MIMGQFFDILTTVVSGTAVFLLAVTAIHASARLVQMTFGRKSGLRRKDTAKSNKAVKNTEPANLPEKKKNRPALMSGVPFTRKNILLVSRWQSGHMSVSSRRMPV